MIDRNCRVSSAMRFGKINHATSFPRLMIGSAQLKNQRRVNVQGPRGDFYLFLACRSALPEINNEGYTIRSIACHSSRLPPSQIEPRGITPPRSGEMGWVDAVMLVIIALIAPMPTPTRRHRHYIQRLSSTGTCT